MRPTPLLLIPFTVLVSASASSHGVTTDPLTASNLTFDYIVVGGGTAGLTLASRLSEDPSVSVLVVEAGPDNRTSPAVTDVTRFVSDEGSSLDWAYKTVDGRTISGGKTLGGSSSINGGSWTRASKAQYDALTKLLEPEDKDKGWDFDGLFAYMKKSETFVLPNATQREAGAGVVDAYHGFEGPVHAGYPLGMFVGPEQPFFAETVHNLTGLKISPDLNGGDPNCVSITPVSLNPHDNDTRSSSAASYLTPVENSRTNWLTLVEHQVTKILFQNDSIPLTATSILFVPTPSTTNSSSSSSSVPLPTYTARASREIILSTGSIRTPALLQLSGIGSTSHLQSLNITPLLDLPTVGKNLQEQTNSPLAASGNGFDALGRGPNDAIAFPNVFQLFGEDEAEEVVEEIKEGVDGWAESQAENAASVEALKTIFEVQVETIVNDTAPLTEFFYATDLAPGFEIGIAMWNLLPFSRGNVSIISADPLVDPQIDVNWFSVPFDLRVQIATAKLARRVVASPPTSTLSAGESIPGFATVPLNATDDEWATWLLGVFSANSHPLGTAAMMRRSLGGVVDAELRVYDTTNLRVVDASILPIQISAHLSATVYGVAEKAADIIKEAWLD